MAFDQHIEADQVGDDSIGLFSSIIARPILWLLGADPDKAAEEERKEERQQLERDILGVSDARDRNAAEDGNSVDKERCEGSSMRATYRDGDDAEHNMMDKGGHPPNYRDSIKKSSDKYTHTSEIYPNQKSWHQVGTMKGTSSAINIPHTKRGDDCSHSMNIVDDLVAAMDSNIIEPKSYAPATSAMETHCELSHSSHSATEFPSKELSTKPPLHKALSSSSMKSKRTSWSDERGNRPLVEYSDDHRETVESKHWTQLRRKKRSSSVDSGDEKRSNTRRSQVRVIKSALRSGSYSPPVTQMHVRGGETSSPPIAPEGQMRSFHSLSGSSSGSSYGDSDDSLVSEMDEKLSMKDNVQCVPSTLQQGGGRGNGGLIIPRGGPSAVYHLTMGTRASSEPQAQIAAKGDQAEGSVTSASTNNNNLVNGRMQAKAPSPHQHVFLPHPPNGHVSPQYGFYVNITPPTSQYAVSRKRGSPLRPYEESSPQQQSFKGFSPFLPSPIPEVELAKDMGAAPTVPPLSQSLESSAGKNRMKPTFPKNRVAMGMVLAGNQHQHAWPSIPMG